MPRRERKYALDTNCFIDAFRTADGVAQLQQFHQVFAPFEYLSVVVAQELRAGVRSRADRGRLEKHLLEPFERTGRILTPSAGVWHDSGNLLSELVRREGLELSRLSKAFANDVLLALSCREAGVVLVTRNTRDFTRIAKLAAFDFVKPWPAPVL